jgi:hypothetical protein
MCHMLIEESGANPRERSCFKKSVPLFNPRQDRWSDHFRWSAGSRLLGRTATGRATISALGMNRPAVIAIRKALIALGWFVPAEK